MKNSMKALSRYLSRVIDDAVGEAFGEDISRSPTNTFGVSVGVRLLLTGLIIVAVITDAGGEKVTR